MTSAADSSAPQRRDDDRPAVGHAFVRLANGITHLHPDDLPGLVGRCAAELGGRNVTLHLVDIDQKALHPFPADSAPSYEVDEVGPTPGTAYRTEAIVRRRDPGGAARAHLWIPLMDSAERLGVIGVTVDDAHDRAEIWTAFASIIAETVVAKTAYGDSIVSARRSRPVSLAAEMRWSLLPPLTFSSPQVEISGVLEPAYDIAGDTFDFAVNANVVSLAILDAMGHGLEASQIANLAVSEYRRGRRSGRMLGEQLHGIDEVIASQFGDHRFVTGQLAELDLASGRLTVVNAGHPPPLVFRDGIDAGDLACRPCLPMGLGHVHTEEATIELSGNDAILFFTDGITESRGSTREQFGRDRLADVVAAGLRDHERPAEILRRVVRATASYVNGPMQDDATAIFLRRPPSPAARR